MTEIHQSWVVDPQASATDIAPALFVERRNASSPDDDLRVVLLHGGGGQGTDWGTTPDGRPGWADLLPDRGWEVHVVDRPGHGRAPGRVPAPAALAMTARIFAPGDVPSHTQWPGTGGVDDAAVRTLAASASGLPPDLVAAQLVERRLIVSLLESIGPSVLIAHSLGACAAWLVADARPDLVTAIVALEPAGPPYLDVPRTPLRLPAGITAAPLASPSGESGLRSVPICVVEAEASPMAAGSGPVVLHLGDLGATAEHIVLGKRGIHGNGHGLALELNNRDVLELVLSWVATALDSHPTPDQPTQQGELR
jgi:pimeloyl-ACP methyl ester carboxylesterase